VCGHGSQRWAPRGCDGRISRREPNLDRLGETSKSPKERWTGRGEAVDGGISRFHPLRSNWSTLPMLSSLVWGPSRSKRISVRVLSISGMFSDGGSNKNSFGGTGQENLAPRVGFFLWRYGLADIYGFDLTSASLESSQRYLELFRPVCEPTAG